MSTNPHPGNLPMMVPRPPGIDGNGFGPQGPVGGGPGGPNGMMNSTFSRSPPQANTKNTKHVPCKFFRQGQCTAGDACPYSHNIESTMTPCQYFLNGNCKYGARCALPHVDRTGNVVKGPGHAKGTGRNSVGRNGRGNRYSDVMPPHQYPQDPMGVPFAFQNPDQTEFYQPQMSHSQQENAFPLDDPYQSPNHIAPNSPPNPKSPQFKGSTALDVGLPASFSSQDAPFKFGPHVASVPARFGWDPLVSKSPTTSINRHQAQGFGNLDSLTLHEPSRNDQTKDLATSPPSTNVGTLPRRIMHSELRSRPQNISNSLPTRDYIDQLRSPRVDPQQHEEDLVPSSLQELLTDREISRRLSRGAEDLGVSPQQSLSAFGSPSDSKISSPKYGSPSQSSRYGALFAKQQEQEGEIRNSPSGFGHVGSPLRNSFLSGQNNDKSQKTIIGPISPPTSHSRVSTVSSLSEQIQRTRISSNPKPDANENGPALPASGSRNISNGSSASNASASNRYSNKQPEPIEEEDCFFSMEELDAQKERSSSTRKSTESTRSRSYAGIAADNMTMPLTGLGVIGSGQHNGGKK